MRQAFFGMCRERRNPHIHPIDSGHIKDRLKNKIIEHLAYAHAEGVDESQIRN